jgi:hypothetical protein
MLHDLLYRPHLVKFTMAMFFAAQMLGWITYAQATEGSAPAASAPPLPPPNSLTAVRRSLREFDRFLDHHPLLENKLRRDPSLTSDKSFQAKNPDLQTFLAANPNVVSGLRIYPRYFLTRALLREANTPMAFGELSPLRDVFVQDPALEHALAENPALIRDPAFLHSHQALADVLGGHPELARVFLPATAPSALK